MKILVVLTYYHPHWTGLTKYAVRLAENLVLQGHQVEVLCVRHEKKLKQKETINGVKVFRTPFFLRFSRSLVAPTLLYELWKHAKKNEVTLIYLPLLEALPAAVLFSLLGKKLLLVHNGDLMLPKKGSFINLLIEKVFYFTTRMSIKLSEGVIIQTRDFASQSKSLSNSQNKWKIILPLYEDKAKKSSRTAKRVKFTKKYKLAGKKLIGYSGRFVEEKGTDVLLRAIPKVIEKVPQVHFIFAGEYKVNYENYWDQIRHLVKKNRQHITLLGLIQNESTLDEFYESLHLLTIPSRNDCFPSSQVEAIFHGVPVVCSDIPGARWVIQKTQMGVLVEPNNSISLAEGIVKVLNNRKKYIKPMSTINQVFNHKKTIQIYEETLKS